MSRNALKHLAAFYVPPGLTGGKIELFETLAGCFRHTIRDHPHRLQHWPWDVIPIVSCRPGVGLLARKWRAKGRPFIYWDRGYLGRRGLTWLPWGGADRHGYFRWTLNGFQVSRIERRPADRWKSLGVQLHPWRRGGRHIVVAAPSEAYAGFHALEGWTEHTVEEIRRHTDRPILVRPKNSMTPLWSDLERAHCLVTHGSIAAIEAAVLGVPVFCDASCAASLVGLTDLSRIEAPIRPDRRPWLATLAWGQFTVDEVRDGTMWRETVERALA